MGKRGSSSGFQPTPPGAQAPAPAAQGAQAGGAQAAAPAPAPQPEPEREKKPQPRVLTQADIPGLQQAMGQTGYEAGDPNASPDNKVYVKTSKSFNINAYLRSDGKSIAAPQNSQWDQLGYTKADAARAIRQIDAGMRPLPEDIQLTRFVGGGALGAILGNPKITSANVGRVISSLSTPAGRAKFAAALQAASYTEKAYTSTTYVQSHPAFDVRRVRLNIVARKGTPAIATNNHAENEILLGHGLKYRFTGGFRVIRTPKGVDQLVIDVEI